MSQIFISYSHKDKKWMNELLKHLKVIGLGNQLNVWADNQIKWGDKWQIEIENALNNANIAVFLISVDFLTSEFIQKEEVPTLLKRKKEEGILILPLIVSSCGWDDVEWLDGLQVMPLNGKTLTDFKGNNLKRQFKGKMEKNAPIPSQEEINHCLKRLESRKGHLTFTYRLLNSWIINP